MLITRCTRVKMVIVLLLVLLLVSTVHASTTFYLRNSGASNPRPTTKQSPDTILNDAATSVARYSNPANMLLAAGTSTQTNEGTFGGTILNHKTHYGSFISPPLYAQTLSGTITVGLVMRESNSGSNNYPRIYVYVWRADNSGIRCDLVSPTTSGTEVTTSYPSSPTTYFMNLPITDCVVSTNDRIVLEIESDDTPANPTNYSHGLRFGGAAGGGYGSYLMFNNDIHLAITAGFTSNLTQGLCDLPIQFTDTSSGNPTQWYWVFGDGGTSTVRNPLYTYTKAGRYTVRLRACNLGGCSWRNATNYVRANMNGSFLGDPTSGYAHLPVTFSDTSNGTPTSWWWAFGDGSTSVLQNPSHTYTRAGTYEVDFRACRGTTCAWSNRTSYISVAMNTVFTSNVTTGACNLLVQFNDTSLGSPDSWLWLFGDGNSSTSRNATHTYTRAGQYEVDFRACRGTTCAWSNRTDYIMATMRAQFTANQTMGNADLPVQFTDQSLGQPTSWYWDFGDGSISTLENPVHVYTQAGTFSVRLQACSGSACGGDNRTSYITVSINPNFTANRTSGDADLNVQFTDLSLGSPDAWLWVFGDGATSSEQHPSHVFTVAGVYDVDLRACRGTYCHWVNYTTYITVTMNTSFLANRTDGKANLPVQFNDTSFGTPTSWIWSFGDGDTSTEKNPLHTYSRAGQFQVNLKACRDAFCDWENKTDFISVSMNTRFTSNVTSGDAHLTVQFIDRSEGAPDTWLWYFGDGNSSDIQNPVHTYIRAGTYEVDLLACRGTFCTWENSTNYIMCDMATSFLANQMSGDADISVQFTDTSLGTPNTWFWEFGDGATSIEQNPFHVYTEAGTFNVSLNACLGSTCRLKTIAEYITVIMNASFSAMPTSGDADLPVQFTDTAKGSPDSWYWEFGDGATSIEKNPRHTYTRKGHYGILFRACRGVLCDWENRTQFINVNKREAPPRAYIRLSGGKTSSMAGASDGYVGHLGSGEPYTISMGDTTPVSSVTLTLQEPAHDLLIRIEKFDSLPIGISPPPGVIYGYFRIYLDSTLNTAVRFATIGFSVKRGWLEENRYSPDDIYLLIYRNDRWEALPTDYLSDRGDDVLYEGETGGLGHSFVIVGMPPSEVAGVTHPGITPFDSMTVWVAENTIQFSMFLLAIVLLLYVSLKYYIQKKRESLPPGEGPDSGEGYAGFIEGDKEKAWSAIIDVLNHIDAQLNEIDIMLAAKVPGYISQRKDAKAVVDRFFFSCQVAERRIKGAAANNHLTKDQIVYLNDQLKQAVDRMIFTSKQSDLLDELVKETLDAQAGA